MNRWTYYLQRSLAEEIIGILWLIAAVIAFETDDRILGWVCAINCAVAILGATIYAWLHRREIK